MMNMDEKNNFFDVSAVGELLIDFTPAGHDPNEDQLFAQKPGGAPANVLAASCKLGGKTAFIGKVGNDMFGRFLRKTLDGLKIDTSGLVTDPVVPTTLAFVQLDENGDRSFRFYRNPGADIMLQKSEIPQNIIDRSHIFHFGSVSLTSEPSRSATIAAVQAAKEHGCIISYDPNYRPPLWNNVHEAREQMLAGLKLADIVKVSEEEMLLLTGETDLQRGSLKLGNSGASLVLVSLGAKGAFFRKNSLTGRIPTYDVKTIDTNGAGDAFLGAALFCLRKCSLEEIRALSNPELTKLLSFANAAGALATSKNGAIPSMPTLEEIENCRKNIPLLN